mmetsp:Transcript_123544/g.349279  ORF Transcript_123544/g.349279 Transcript_123544/m.349279 type:complete len:293 (-) Transcript_123544:92-970(-)
MASIHFEVDCTDTKPGDIVFIVGSAPELGAWDPLKALPCATSPKTFPRWTSDRVSVDASHGKVEFKLLVQPSIPIAKDQASWEDGGNRCLHLPRNSCGKGAVLTVTCVWGRPEVSSRIKGAGFGAGSDAGGAVCSGATVVGMHRVDTGMHPLMAQAAGESSELAGGDADATCNGGLRPAESGVVGMPRVDTGMHPLVAQAIELGDADDAIGTPANRNDGDTFDGLGLFGSTQVDDGARHPKDFAPITIDGRELTAASLDAMRREELQDLIKRLGPVLDAAKQALAVAQGGAT